MELFKHLSYNMINNLFLGKYTYIYLLKCQEQAQAVNALTRFQLVPPSNIVYQ